MSVVVRRGEFTRASLLCCGLFVAEDPGIIAARRALGEAWPGMTSGIAIDVLLGITMTGYNYAASRYVVTVGQASSIDAAIRQLGEMRVAAIDADRRRLRRAARRLFSRLNPFNLIKLIAERFAMVIERLRTRANQRALAGVAEVLGELAAVNVLGVPGAGLESVARREAVSSRTSLRHATLFVVSWFAGARLLGAFLGSMYAIPGIGRVIATLTGVTGRCFDAVTDVRHPIGIAAIAAVVVGLVHYSRAVERLAASIQERTSHETSGRTG
ncbi:MAG: hypothetical protein ABI862_02815 [Ilumatobacteraceae bacterium]